MGKPSWTISSFPPHDIPSFLSKTFLLAGSSSWAALVCLWQIAAALSASNPQILLN